MSMFWWLVKNEQLRYYRNRNAEFQRREKERKQKEEQEKTDATIEESDTLSAMRVTLDEERQQEIDKLQNSLNYHVFFCHALAEH